MNNTSQICTFRSHNYLFGIHALSVQEVIRYQEITEVPLAPKSVRGLINLRGQVVPAIDLKERMGQPPFGPNDRPMNVVVRSKTGIASLLVDQIGDVIIVDSERFEEPPGTLDGPSRRLICGAYKLEQQLLLLLDLESAVQIE